MERNSKAFSSSRYSKLDSAYKTINQKKLREENSWEKPMTINSIKGFDALREAHHTSTQEMLSFRKKNETSEAMKVS